jgi:hypothetical protein
MLMLLTGRVSPLRRQAGGMRRHCSFPRLCRPGHTGTTPAGRRVPWRVRACTAEARNHRSSRGVLVRLPKEKARAINLTAAGSVGGRRVESGTILRIPLCLLGIITGLRIRSIGNGSNSVFGFRGLPNMVGSGIQFNSGQIHRSK